MKNFQDVFCRVEKKYLLTQAQTARMIEGVSAHGMRPDDFGRHTISNIYYDTPDYELIRRSLEKPIYKEKLRLRAYGKPTRDSEAFVEIKKKFHGVVYKRRIEAPLSDAVRCLREGRFAEDTGQIGREIEYFLRFWQPEPRMMIAYDRVAFFSPEREDLRITFDDAIRYRLDDLDLAHGAGGALILPDGVRLMELKLSGAMPLWLPPLLTRCGARCTSFSKYGRAYELMTQNQQERESLCSA